VDKLRLFFTDHMVKTIQQIPISTFGGDDYASWPFDRFGIYTVRSAYNLARTEKFFSKRGAKGFGDSSDHVNQGKSWKAIWAITSPTKM
jgi:hypothetical protein